MFNTLTSTQQYFFASWTCHSPNPWPLTQLNLHTKRYYCCYFRHHCLRRKSDSLCSILIVFSVIFEWCQSKDVTSCSKMVRGQSVKGNLLADISPLFNNRSTSHKDYIDIFIATSSDSFLIRIVLFLLQILKLKIPSHSLKKSRSLWLGNMDDSAPTYKWRKMFPQRLWLLKYVLERWCKDWLEKLSGVINFTLQIKQEH